MKIIKKSNKEIIKSSSCGMDGDETSSCVGVITH